MALIAVAADKGAPGRHDRIGGIGRGMARGQCSSPSATRPAATIVYRLPGAGGNAPRTRVAALLSLAVAARPRPAAGSGVGTYARKTARWPRCAGGRDYRRARRRGLTRSGTWSAGLLSRIPQARCGSQIAAGSAGTGRSMTCWPRAEAVVLITRASLAEVVRLRDRAVGSHETALHRRGRPGARGEHRGYRRP